MRTLGAGAQQAMPGNRTLDAITAPAAALSMNSKSITNLLGPTNGSDAATKTYVDNATVGFDAKKSVRVATTGNVTLSGIPTIDGVTMGDAEEILVKNQTNPAQNGIYWVQVGAWARRPDLDTWGEVPGAFVFVEEGTVNADTGWLCTADAAAGVIGTTAMPWTQFAGPGEYVGGAGLTKTGNSFDVGAGPGITVNADTVQVANNGITNAMIADGAIALNTADVTGSLPVANGGTGGTTPKTARTGILAPGIYRTNQPPSVAASFTIAQATHQLGQIIGNIVQVQDNTTGAIELPDVVVAANGDVTITYAAPVAISSKHVTILG